MMSGGESSDVSSVTSWKTMQGARGLRSPLIWAGLLTLGLLGDVYGPLLVPPEAPDLAALTAEGEQFFFEVNEAAGAPVLVLSLWLFFRRSHLRDVLNGPGEPLLGSAVFAATLALHAWGVFTGAPDLQLASLIGFLFGLQLMWGGRAAVKAFWVPTLFLGFALPLSPVLVSTVIWPIQLATAAYAGLLLNLIGVPSFVQGDQILRPENTFIVIETCSGLRSVVTLLMLTVLLIDLFERRGKHAVALLVLAPIVALLTNGIRVVSLVLNPHSDVASIHSLQGIAMLLVGLTLMYLLDGLLARILGSDAEDAASTDYGNARLPAPQTPSRMVALASPVLILSLLLAAQIFVAPWDAQRPLATPVDRMVETALGDWPSESVSPDYMFRGGIHFRSWSRRRVHVDGQSIDLLVGLANPTNRKLSAFSPRLPWAMSGYEVVEETTDRLAPDAMPARRMLLQRGATTLLSYSWYEPAPNLMSELFVHALAIDRSPLARAETAVAVRMTTRVRGPDDEAASQARMAQVHERLKPLLEALRSGSSGSGSHDLR